MKDTRPWRRIALIVSGVVLLSLVVGAVFGLRNMLQAQTGATTDKQPAAAVNAAGPQESGREGGVGPYEKKGPEGPIFVQGDAPSVFDGSLTELVGTGDNPAPLNKFGVEEENGEAKTPNMERVVPNPEFNDPVAQMVPGAGLMPAPLSSYDGLMLGDGGGWHPPDTSGDVGPNHYIQAVNIAIGIYDKATGAELVNLPYNSFFSPAPSPCNNQNRGDVVIIYDEMADRWLVTDFSLPSTGPVYECIAISQSGDPVNGGWYYYAFIADNDGSPWNDYPKLSVWPDAYYMTANMFDPWSGAYVWALNRDAMLNGQPLTAQEFHAGSAYGSLLSANVRGTLPPAGSPNYLASFDFPNTLHVWKLFIDWDTPANSHLDGPVNLTTANAAMIDGIPQRGTSQVVDTLGDRMMFQLQYRNMGDYESLWVNHTVASSGVAGIRWYEVRDLSATPSLYQQGTYDPGDGQFRWMGSLAVDQDGNMALGYSVSSTNLFPAIRYTGRLNGEALGQLLQGEASLVEGTGSQAGSNRWGDYSQMSIDPTDDCTFWYTTEYFQTISGTWYTRFGSFRFPSCGQPKGFIQGFVYNQDGVPVVGAPVVAAGELTTFTAVSQPDGSYSIAVPAGTYNMTAGPLLPSYPGTDTYIADVVAGSTTTHNFVLQGMPVLAYGSYLVDDNVPGGNANGFPEPGESGLLLYAGLTNDGAASATAVSAHLTTTTAGVTITAADATYPDIPAGQTLPNETGFAFSISPDFPCGGKITFTEEVTTAEDSFTVTFDVYAGVTDPRQNVFADNMENGNNGWTTGGYPNTWGLTTSQSHSPTHSWTDSPNGSYTDNTNNWVKSPVINLSGKTGVQLDFWHKVVTESGWDYGYPEYSLNGTTWQSFYPDGYTGDSGGWLAQNFDASVLDNQSTVYLRFRLSSDGGVTADGWYIDDVAVSYQPYTCSPVGQPPATPELVSPADGSVFTGTQEVTLEWTSIADATGYTLDVNGTTFTTTQTTMSFMVDGETFTWKVNAYNDFGTSAWTDPWTFIVHPVYKLFLPLVLK